MKLNSLTAISPIDGRYGAKLTSLRSVVSEFALIKYRIIVEIEWFKFLASLDQFSNLPKLDNDTIAYLDSIGQNFDLAAAEQIKTIEQETNHDVKAVEYHLQQQFTQHEVLKDKICFIHFACTSEDINNLAYALMLQELRNNFLSTELDSFISKLATMAAEHADIAMLARTHGQAATPTTLGKEIKNFSVRLSKQLAQLSSLNICAKINGAVGNFNAHQLACPEVNWPQAAQQFIEQLGLCYNSHSTQIENHDFVAELAHCQIRINNILIDFARDIWGYISLGYFQQHNKAGEVGSSTMPHKINPIDFENAEGNLGIASSLLDFMANKLPISRFQRDLSDSTVMRNIGLAFSYSLLSLQSLQRGLSKLKVNSEVIAADLAANPEVLAEAVQTVLRYHGVADAYEQLKALTRGSRFDLKQFREFIQQLALPEAEQQQLMQLEPKDYIGLAATLAK